jgi:hypothetical protein
VNGPYDVAVDGTFIYWTNASDGTIGRANLDGTGIDPSFISGINGLGEIAVVVPEPATGSLLLAGLAGLAALRSRAGFGWRRTQR